MTSTISRRQILSRSRDTGLNQQQQQHQLNNNKMFAPYEDYEEMWFSHEHLFKDHIAEVLRKWEQIDDEIWAKMIFMCRNRRIAKAYVRVPAVIIDGTDNGFDGYRVGLNGFEDPFRDSMTDQLMSHIEKGCRIGIDDLGNILIKRYSMANVYVRSYPLDYSHSCVDNNIIRMNGCLELQKKYILFDINKFEIAMMNELKSAYPDRSRLEQQCIVIIGFVRNNNDSILDMPCYVMLINIVALDMLKSKLNPVMYRNIVQNKKRVPEFVSIFHQQNNNNSEFCSDNDDYNYDDNNKSDNHQIYGKFIDSSCDDSDNYLWKNNNYYKNQQNGYNNIHNNNNNSKRRYGPQSMPTLINIHNKNNNHRSSSSSVRNLKPSSEISLNIDDNKPPKLPPRDKKKLSRQISTIKSARKNQKNLMNNIIIGRSIEIPSPDYNQHNDELLSSSSSSTSSSTTIKIKTKSKTNRTTKRFNDNYNNDDDDENIYGTIMNKNYPITSLQRGQNGRFIIDNKNWPSTTIRINDQYERSIMSKSMPTYCISNNINKNVRTVTVPSSYHYHNNNDNSNHHHHRHHNHHHHHYSYSVPINRTFRGDASNLIMNHNHHHLDEDPYYSGLEARVTSNRLNQNNKNRQNEDINSHTKTKGLNWMMRKVLSTNYINMLTSRRQKKQTNNNNDHNGTNNNNNNKTTKSKSSTNESSTDSDPYVSINDVYEPIYGYGNPNLMNSRISTSTNGWTTIQARLKS